MGFVELPMLAFQTVICVILAFVLWTTLLQTNVDKKVKRNIGTKKT